MQLRRLFPSVAIIALLTTSALVRAQPGVDLLLSHKEAVLSVAYSPDGKYIAVGCADKLVHVWEVSSGKEVMKLESHTSAVVSVAFSPDGKRILSVGKDDGLACAWDMAGGALVWKYNMGAAKVTRLACSPDGRAVTISRDNSVSNIDAPTGKEMMRMMGHKDAITAIAHSPDGKLLVTASKDGTAGMWELGTGRQVRLFRFEGEPTSAAFSPDGKVLALGLVDKQVRVFNAATGEVVQQLKDPTGAVRCVAFSPDGKTLAACGDDRMIRLWDAESGKLLRQAIRHTGAVTALAFSPDGKSICSAGDDKAVMVSTVEKLRDFKLEPIDLTDKQLDELWSDLSGKDVAKGQRAVFTLAAGAKYSVPFLRDKVKPAEATTEEKQTFKLIRDLDDDAFEVRERATEELQKLAKSTGWILKKALESAKSAEVKQRLGKILEKVGADAQPSPEQARDARIIDVLEYIGTKEAKDLLAKLAEGSEEAQTTQLAKQALNRLKKSEK